VAGAQFLITTKQSDERRDRLHSSMCTRFRVASNTTTADSGRHYEGVSEHKTREIYSTPLHSTIFAALKHLQTLYTCFSNWQSGCQNTKELQLRFLHSHRISCYSVDSTNLYNVQITPDTNYICA